MEDSVKKVLDYYCDCVSEWAGLCFVDEIEGFINDGYSSWPNGCESPIEQILFIALLYNIKVNEFQEADPITIGNYDFVYGIKIDPQETVGKYRVDFKVSMEKYLYDRENNKFHNESKSVFVECDSQEWHERTEKERRYEKRRDRYFLKNNLKIFHYTGKEILTNPHSVAAEILTEVTGRCCLIDQN